MVASFLHLTLPLASEETLKDPRGTSEEVRRVDLTKWALRTSPKFTTGEFNVSNKEFHGCRHTPSLALHVIFIFIYALQYHEMFPVCMQQRERVAYLC